MVATPAWSPVAKKGLVTVSLPDFGVGYAVFESNSSSGSSPSAVTWSNWAVNLDVRPANTPQEQSDRPGGMTLIELLVGLIIGTIITTTTCSAGSRSTSRSSFAVNSNIARDNARQVIMRMERELRDTQQPVQSPKPA